MAQLFGYSHASTKKWIDGLFPSILRGINGSQTENKVNCMNGIVYMRVCFVEWNCCIDGRTYYFIRLVVIIRIRSIEYQQKKNPQQHTIHMNTQCSMD